MRLVADECCDMAVVRALRSAGHDVLSIRESLPGAADDAVARVALEESRILLTEDKDFGQLVHASSAKAPGVIFVRFPASARQSMIRTVVELVNMHDTQLHGCFAVVEPGRVRLSQRRTDE